MLAPLPQQLDIEIIIGFSSIPEDTRISLHLPRCGLMLHSLSEDSVLSRAAATRSPQLAPAGPLSAAAAAAEDQECDDNEPRICWCVKQAQPRDCPQCYNPAYGGHRNRTPCPSHVIVTCSKCPKQFHRGCLTSILHRQIGDDVSDFICIECRHSEVSVQEPEWSQLWSAKAKNLRYGLPAPNGHFRDGEHGVVNMRK